MAFAVADLVHPNHPQSIELAPLIPLLGNHSLDDPSHRTPRHSEIVRYGADVRPLCQPRYLLFEAFGKAASLVGPRHLFSDHSTPPTYHSSDGVAKIGPDSEQVQVPPVAIVAIFVLADLSSANPANPAQRGLHRPCNPMSSLTNVVTRIAGTLFSLSEKKILAFSPMRIYTWLTLSTHGPHQMPLPLSGRRGCGKRPHGSGRSDLAHD